MNEVLIILGTVIAVIIFSKLKGYIVKTFFKNTYNMVLDKTTKTALADLYKKGVITVNEYKKKLGKYAREVFPEDTKERFEPKKLRKIWDLLDPVEWIKSLKEIGILDVRKWIILGLIVSSVFAYGWYKGKEGTPVKIDIGYGKEVKIGLEGGQYLHIDKNGRVYLKEKDGTILKNIAVKDIEGLRKKLAPIGIQCVPIAVMGVGVGLDGISGEMGVGISWLRYWRWRLDAFITNKGFYPLATSYKLTTNSGIGIGIGAGWAGDTRTIIYYNWKF